MKNNLTLLRIEYLKLSNYDLYALLNALFNVEKIEFDKMDEYFTLINVGIDRDVANTQGVKDKILSRYFNVIKKDMSYLANFMSYADVKHKNEIKETLRVMSFLGDV